MLERSVSSFTEKRDNLINELLEETDTLIQNFFSKGDATRNEKVQLNLKMLSVLQGVSYKQTWQTFGLPPSGLFRRQNMKDIGPEEKREIEMLIQKKIGERAGNDLPKKT